MKLESLNSSKFEAIEKSQLKNIRGGGEGSSSGNVCVEYNGKTYRGQTDKFSTDDHGNFTCLEIDGVTII